MIPIFLWSVVVTQSIQRLVWRGRVTSWVSTWGIGRNSEAGRRSVSVVVMADMSRDFRWC